MQWDTNCSSPREHNLRPKSEVTASNIQARPDGISGRYAQCIIDVVNSYALTSTVYNAFAKIENYQKKKKKRSLAFVSYFCFFTSLTYAHREKIQYFRYFAWVVRMRNSPPLEDSLNIIIHLIFILTRVLKFSPFSSVRGKGGR